MNPFTLGVVIVLAVIVLGWIVSHADEARIDVRLSDDAKARELKRFDEERHAYLKATVAPFARSSKVWRQ